MDLDCVGKIAGHVHDLGELAERQSSCGSRLIVIRSSCVIKRIGSGSSHIHFGLDQEQERLTVHLDEGTCTLFNYFTPIDIQSTLISIALGDP